MPQEIYLQHLTYFYVPGTKICSNSWI